MLPRVSDQLAELRSADASTVRARAGAASDLDPALAGRARHRTAYRGLEVLAVYLEARRLLLFDRFREFWAEQERKGTWDQLDRAAVRRLDEARERRRAAERAVRAARELERAEQEAREAAARGREAAAELAAARREQRSREEAAPTPEPRPLNAPEPESPAPSSLPTRRASSG
jgi:hypothetical protein